MLYYERCIELAVLVYHKPEDQEFSGGGAVYGR